MSATPGRGQILRIDLTTESITKEPISEELARQYLGGVGINARLLWEHFLKVDPKIDPAGPENVIIAGLGPLGGTGYGAGTKVKFTFKSPLTGFYGDSAAGGAFGPNLRWAGYDHVVITGRANRPVYIWIHDDDVQLRDAAHLWGKEVPEANHLIKAELGHEDLETACVGPAGEQGVAFANIQVSEHRAAGRCGGGHVLASKNVKAIAVRGTKGIAIHDPQRFMRAADVLISQANRLKVRDPWKNAGTMSVFGWYNRGGFSPYRNNQSSSVPRERYETTSTRWYLDNLAVGPLSCSPGCISGCSGFYRIKGDESPGARDYAGESGTRMELAAQIGFGGQCDVSDMPAQQHLWRMCAEYGVDVIETAMCCAFLLELWQRGIIDQRDTAAWVGEPITLEWGNYRSVAKLIESIALQRNELGRIFKDGLYQAARRIEEIKGVPALPYAVYGKGGMSFVAEIRCNPSWGISMAVASRGADHLKGAVGTFERFSRPDLSRLAFGSPDAAEPYTATMKGRDCARAENRVAVVNSLGMCTFIVTLETATFPLDLFTEALSAVTGMEITAPELAIAGERVANLEKAFNSRLGLRREDDRLCARWLNEPVDHPQALGMKGSEWLDPTKDDYYEARGWDKATALQTRQRLEALGLHDVAEVLAREGALAPEAERRV